MGEEALYRGERTQVVRRPAPDGPERVVGKRAAGPGAVGRIAHERSVLRRLAGIPGVPRLAATQGRQTLILEDDAAGAPDGTRLPVARVVEIARALATTVAAVHRAGVIHRDIAPANVILPAAGPPILIDYDLALLPGDAAGTPSGEPVGTLGYLAPEQTGRIGLAVDRRADLYGLGATLYALLAGEPPFPGDDPLELVRDTLVRVPAAPADRCPSVPRRLSDIVMRLLEKDPDRRYQSAEGLAYDLARVAGDPSGSWPLGEQDFPAYLMAPPRLVGRYPEVRLLAGALDRAQADGCPAVVVTGPPGIGKSALTDTLRPAIAARGGWFARGKYDQFRAGPNSGGLTRALRGLVRLLLAEPETEAIGDRQRITEALGPNAGLLAAAVPELEAFLGHPPEPAAVDPATVPTRLSGTVAALLRAIAVRHQIVFVLDDLQWAGGTSLHIVDAVLAAGRVPGLLIVVAYRDGEVDEAHPLAPLAARWQAGGDALPPVRLAGLPESGQAELVAAVLRLAPDIATGLARLIGPGGDGNPYAIVELINALRAEDLLRLTRDGWRWDPEAVRAFAAHHHVPQLLVARLEQQPEATRELLAALACLGGDVRPALLAAAAGLPGTELAQRLAPAVEDGLVVHRAAPGTVRFRHDLVERAAREVLADDDRDRLRLAMARRLAGRPDGRQEAAEQYLPVTGLIDTARERSTAAGLLHEAGRRAARIGNHSGADGLLDAAGRLLAPARGARDGATRDGATRDGATRDGATRDAVAVDRHATLYCLGRLGEADEIYHDLVGRSPGLLTLAAATAIQINSLAQRGDPHRAVGLGLEVLRRFGIKPPDDLAGHIRDTTAEMYGWVARPAAGTEATDPATVAAGRLINRLLPPAFQLDPLLHAWLVLEAYRLWDRHGVCAPVIGTLGAAICVTVDQRDDYRTGYLLSRRVVAAGRERGYQAETAIASYMHLFLTAHWFEPLEEIVEAVPHARDELLAAGDVQVAGLLWARLLAIVLDSGDSLEACADEIPSALAFAERTGNRYAALTVIAYRQLVHALRGRTSAPGGFATPDFDEAGYLAEVASYPPTHATYRINRALAALLFGDQATLEAESAAAMASCRAVRGFYVSALARVVRCLSLTARLRDRPGDMAAATELAQARDWIARRAADAPGNFRPLLRLVDAERAWQRGDHEAAARDFDAGLHEVTGRPWHRALLAERAARFHLDRGFAHAGERLLAEARDTYRAWGADGLLSRLEHDHPGLCSTTGGRSGAAGRIDLMAILRAARALSSQTTISGLEAQVGTVLSAMTGATDVRLAIRHQETSHWSVATITGAATDPPLPLTAVRYALRTREPMLVADAVRDDRFAHDPYVTGLETCALLVVPIPSRSVARAVLVLENRAQTGVFSADRLEMVRLIAGQLAVSLDNALLYDSLESTVRERTAEIAAANRRLADSERRLRSHFEHAAIGQVIHGTDDRIEEANPAFVAMVGTGPGALAGTRLTDRFDPAGRAAHRRELGAVIAGTQRVISHEVALLRAFGDRLDAHVTVSAVLDADGRPDHLVSIFQDIRARKVAEAARDRAHLELADRNRDLEAANQLKTDLIGMLGHEINNPLAMILGYLEVLLAEEGIAAPAQELLGRTHRNARRLATIVHEVLTLVSVEAGRLTAHPQPVRVADHIEAALAAGTTAEIAVNCPGDLTATVQPGHLDQILTNLISNAGKYGGGATAIIAHSTPDPPHPVVTVEVRDHGPGVPPEFRGHLFDRFARAEATAGKVSGTGLGLYIVRELARANDGDVEYRPAPGGGSIFVVTLPATAETAQP